MLSQWHKCKRWLLNVSLLIEVFTSMMPGWHFAANLDFFWDKNVEFVNFRQISTWINPNKNSWNSFMHILKLLKRLIKVQWKFVVSLNFYKQMGKHNVCVVFLLALSIFIIYYIIISCISMHLHYLTFSFHTNGSVGILTIIKY